MHTGSKKCGNKSQHVRLTLQTGNRLKTGGECTSQSEREGPLAMQDSMQLSRTD